MILEHFKARLFGDDDDDDDDGDDESSEDDDEDDVDDEEQEEDRIVHMSEFRVKSTLHPRRRAVFVAMLCLEIQTSLEDKRRSCLRC